MEQKSSFVAGFLTKYAATFMSRALHPARTLGAMKRLYRHEASTPLFKAKKALGWGILGTGGVAYAGHKLLTPPQQRLTGPGEVGIPGEQND
mgnify:CR=1 FL=1